MHDVCCILGFCSLQVAASCKYNEMHSIAKILFSTKHVHLNPKPQNTCGGNDLRACTMAQTSLDTGIA